MGALVAMAIWLVAVLMFGGVFGCVFYGVWNIALVPWFGWRVMPGEEAMALGVIAAALAVTAKVRQ